MSEVKTAPAPVLLVEDSKTRIRWFEEHLPVDLRLVKAGSAGRALGVIRRDRGYVYAAILLDHDLQGQAATTADRGLSGTQVVQAVIEFVDPDVPILVHSANVDRAPEMVAKLDKAGFDVERRRFELLSTTPGWLAAWLREAREEWLEVREEGA